jgi:hypothetical protein
VLSLVGLFLGSPASAEGDDLVVLPSEFVLRGPEARQPLLVEIRRAGQFVGEANDVEFSSSDPQVLAVEDGVAVPVGDGEAEVIVRSTGRSAGRAATARVRVTDTHAPFAWSFRRHVEAVLTRSGCNGGACHGAFAGKHGFGLSLRGYNPDGDYLAITRHARGRRVNPLDPARSLILLKPTAAVPHKGGQRFDAASIEYRILSEWLAGGAPGPAPEEASVTRIEVLPEHCVLEPDSPQRLLVRAHYADGHAEDVTRWAKFTATNASVAQVDEAGRVKVMGRGEGAVTAWYSSRIAVATVTVPFASEVPEDSWDRAPRRNFIDDLVLKKLRSLRLPPSPPAGDAEFLRRAYLDTVGILPSAEETRAFLADPQSDKRDRLIDALLERPEYVDYWSYKWSDLFLVSSERLRPQAMWAYYAWIRDAVAADVPWDDLARRLLTASGSTVENGAANFFVLHPDPRDMAETASVAFLGMSIQCAKCHNHPLEKWTNDQYYGFANLFARVRSKSLPGDGHHFVFTAASGELVQPLSGRPQRPRPLDGEAIDLDASRDRREHLADWLTSPSNPYFARAVSNRVWANFLGRGLVEAVDDLRLTNPSTNEELLGALGRHLAGGGWRLKGLMRTILQSATYQRSSAALPGNAADDRYYSRFYPRRIMAEVLLDAISQVTGAPTEFSGYPQGWRALQLPDSKVNSYFLKSFGRPDRANTCECERSAEPSMAQALHIANGDTLNKKLAAKGNRVDGLLAPKASGEHRSDDAIIDDAYLSALSRYPSAPEKERVRAILAAVPGSERRAAIEDLFWGLLSAKEFLFNH